MVVRAMLIGHNQTMRQYQNFKNPIDLAMLPDPFAVKTTKTFRKKPYLKVTNPVVIDNVLLTKTKCLEQGNTGHLVNVVIWPCVFLVISLCTGCFSLFKHG